MDTFMSNFMSNCLCYSRREPGSDRRSVRVCVRYTPQFGHSSLIIRLSLMTRSHQFTQITIVFFFSLLLSAKRTHTHWWRFGLIEEHSKLKKKTDSMLCGAPERSRNSVIHTASGRGVAQLIHTVPKRSIQWTFFSAHNLLIAAITMQAKLFVFERFTLCDEHRGNSLGVLFIDMCQADSVTVCCSASSFYPNETYPKKVLWRSAEHFPKFCRNF